MVTRVITIRATRDGRELPQLEIDLSRLTEAQLFAAAWRGIEETIRNTYASIKADDPKCLELSVEARNDWVNRLYSGEVWSDGKPGNDGGGKRLSPLEKHLRVILANWLHKSKGFKMSDAVKAASDGRAIVDALAAQKHPDAELAKLAADTAMAEFTRLAQIRVDEDNANKGLDI